MSTQRTFEEEIKQRLQTFKPGRMSSIMSNKIYDIIYDSITQADPYLTRRYRIAEEEAKVLEIEIPHYIPAEEGLVGLLLIGSASRGEDIVSQKPEYCVRTGWKRSGNEGNDRGAIEYLLARLYDTLGYNTRAIDLTRDFFETLLDPHILMKDLMAVVIGGASVLENSESEESALRKAGLDLTWHYFREIAEGMRGYVEGLVLEKKLPWGADEWIKKWILLMDCIRATPFEQALKRYSIVVSIQIQYQATPQERRVFFYEVASEIYKKYNRIYKKIYNRQTQYKDPTLEKIIKYCSPNRNR
jgi:hypothetical protein